MTIGYVTIGCHDVEAAVPFFEKTLEPLGYERSYPAPGGAFFGPRDAPPTLEILTPFDGGPPRAGNGIMVALQAQSKEQVHAVHAAALANGGSDEGAPGYRPPGAENGFYGAYFRDPVGNKFAVFVWA